MSAKASRAGRKAHHTGEFLEMIGVPQTPPRTSPFDPGYDPATLISHLEQSAHLISSLKISMACWLVANEKATREKVRAARKLKVPVCTGGGPFEIAVAFGKLPQFLDLCADIGVTHIEGGAGFTDMRMKPKEVVRLASERGLGVQFEIGEKHAGTFTSDVVERLLKRGKEWLSAGAVRIVVEGRESAKDVGLFDEKGQLQPRFAERFVEAFGMERAVFEAPNKSS
ncbi:MAG: phosphosulfolactate synthase, partial [Vicinamibacteria bacterium]